MELKNTFTLLILLIFISTPGFSGQRKRPVELQFYVSTHLNTITMIEYNDKGDVLKMSSYENKKLTDYAKYKYDPEGKLSFERTYDASNILIKTRKYFYDESGLVTGEKVYSPSGKLIEYLVINWNDKKIRKIDYYRPDENIFQTIEFNYTNETLTAMVFNKIGKYIMIMKAVYDKDMLLIGHNIKHSNADIKIETKYIYEDGYATDQALQIIFR